MVEDDFIRRASDDHYREKIKSVYGGPQGAFLAACSFLSLHTPLGERVFRSRRFDLGGMKSILDVGSGAGQLASHLLHYADNNARITCLDLSLPMLRRARERLDSPRPQFVVGDLASLPFVDEAFDGITCGYVLEHLPDPRPGLAELARVLRPGGRMFLLTTEDTLAGAWTSRLWCCRTYNRAELRQTCRELGLLWKEELWFTPLHRKFRAGGICVELQRSEK